MALANVDSFGTLENYHKKCVSTRFHLLYLMFQFFGSFGISTVPTDNTVPEFGEYIRPSYMIIDVSESTSCSRCVIWIQNCINNFPFPNELRRLTISITIHLQYVRKFPDPIDYQVLTNVLQRLYKHGSLRHINLNIVLQGNGPIEAAFNQASEVEKLSNAFAMLLEAKALGIKLVFQRLWHRRTEVTSTCAIVA